MRIGLCDCRGWDMPKYATGNLKNKENQGYNSVWGQRLEKCGCEFLSVCVCVCVCVCETKSSADSKGRAKSHPNSRGERRLILPPPFLFSIQLGLCWLSILMLFIWLHLVLAAAHLIFPVSRRIFLMQCMDYLLVVHGLSSGPQT